MKKAILGLAALIFLVLVVRLVFQEFKRYQRAEEKIEKVVNKTEFTGYNQFYDIMSAAEKTLININDPAEEIAKWKAENERGYVLKGGTVVTYLDNFMFSLEKKVAKPEEIQKVYLDYFQVLSSGFYRSSILFYLVKLLTFSMFSFLPVLFSIVITIAPVATAKYATAFGFVLMLAVIKQSKAQDQTFFEADLFNQNGKNHYEFLLFHLSDKMTSVVYVPQGSVIAATGPNMTLGNGSFSLLGGVCAGHNGKDLAVTDVTFWYVYFGSLFDGAVDYTTFGLYDEPLYSREWWVWFKHQFNLPVTEKIGVGIREDTNINAGGLHITYGPTIKFQWNSMSIYTHCRFGDEEKTLLIRAEIPIN